MRRISSQAMASVSLAVVNACSIISCELSYPFLELSGRQNGKRQNETVEQGF